MTTAAPRQITAAERKARKYARLLRRFAKLRDVAKTAYEQADVLEDQILGYVFKEKGSINLPDGRVISAKDNYTDKEGNFKNVAYRPAKVKHYEIEVSDPEA